MYRLPQAGCSGYNPPVTSPLRQTPLYGEHQALGARMVPFAGWQMPVKYEGIVAEHHAVRQRAGLFDVSHMGELSVVGPDAIDVVNALVTSDVRRLNVGKALYTLLCNEKGGIIDDLIVYRHGAEALFVVCNASNVNKVAPRFASHAQDRNCRFADETQAWALLALQGPAATQVLTSAGLADKAASLPPFGLCAIGADYKGLWVARTGYTGEDGFELFCPAAEAVSLWRKLLDAGSAVGLRPVGLGARDTLRLEARLCLHGNDIDETTLPFEAGLGWTVHLDKGDFSGRPALVDAKARPLPRKLVGFEMTGRGIARHGYPIVDATGRQVGHVTSGSPSPTLGKHIGLGYVPIDLASVGSTIHVEIRGKAVDARVVKTPFYRRES